MVLFPSDVKPVPEQPLPRPSVYRLFEERAAQTPAALAVSSSDHDLSYSALNARSAQLARHLRRLGAGPENLVALLCERTPELVVAALATLKTGAAYLPIDPAQPADRLRHILRDSRAQILLTTASALSRFPDLETPSGIVFADRVEDEVIPTAPECAPRTDPLGLAYVIYTSGSTGAPKGVELHHHGLSNLVAWYRERYRLGPDDRVSMVASPGFDASLWEMWPALTAGASLHLAPSEVILSPAAFLTWAARQGITVAFLPTPLAEALLAEPMPAELRLRWLHSGGDRLQRRPPPGLPFAVSNVYGPTEATIVATEAAISPEGEGPPPIGRPIGGGTAHLLDANLLPLAPHLEGELWLGGAGVGRGYLRRPDLTAERFVPDPFGAVAGARLYRTGDLVRWLPSGELEFLGRLDQQVKIRGFRVELGEIETALLRHPEVREAAVLAREGRLIGYVALQPGAGRDARALREHLTHTLTEVMIPGSWVFLEALPLNVSGKVDRQALERIAPASPFASTAVAPRTAAEGTMLELWREILGFDAAGVDDSFLDLGGHSLAAVRLAARIRTVFGVDPGLRGVFEHPTVATLADWVEQQATEDETTLPLVGLQFAGPAPLSFAQQRLWFVERLRPGTAIYNLGQTLDLQGDLCIAALAGAIQAILGRHEALRTVFSTGAQGEPHQIVATIPRSAHPLSLIDLAALPETARRSESERIALEETRRPYDLESGPLFRADLLSLGAGGHRLFIGFHHVVSDGWSMKVLMQDLEVLYRAARTGGEGLPPLPVQYPAYAVWQRRWLTDDIVRRRMAYWRSHLSGVPQVLELPADRPRPALPSHRGERLRLAIAPELETALAAWSRSRAATPFMSLLATFQVLIQRWTQQEDFVLGVPVAGRNRPEVEGMIGFFVNLLPLRARCPSTLAFGSLIAGVRESVLAAFSQQDLPFDRLVEELAPARDPSRSPLVQVAFALQDAAPRPDFGSEGPRVTDAAERFSGASELDLVFLLEGRSGAGEGLQAIAEHALDLFDRETMHRLLRGFHTLLAAIVTDPACTVGELPLLSPAERDQVVSLWNQTATEVSSMPVHGLFAQRAAEAPAALAVSGGEVAWTYGELDAGADVLASRLRRLGAGPEGVVALLLERSPELILATLATLKAGAAYLPVDPAWPPGRVEHVLRDAGALALLTTESVVSRFPGLPIPAERIVQLDGGLESGSAPADVAFDPENLAYVIYTSGSTGVPKGTEIPHRALTNLASWNAATFTLGVGQRLSMVAAPGFDASAWEIWPALISGASLHLPPQEILLSPATFLSWAAEQAITIAFLPTLLAEAVLGEPLPSGLRLRFLQSGGDRLVRRPAPGLPFALFNVYGPTEATIVATATRVAAHDGARPPHIGRPIANLRAFVLDPGAAPVPVGVPGELFLAGIGLGRGYRDRPDLTAERFVPDPFSPAGGERLYRTGDRARWLSSGNLDFLGRIDHQVKIRGQRIELGEVEAVLARQPGVREAAVIALDGRLSAFVVPVAGPEVPEEGVDTLRAALRLSLPEAMLPTGWAFLDALPLTANGKVDRKALAQSAPRSPTLGAAMLLETATEAAVAALWAELLGAANIGAGDDFFALGGHSLLATRLSALVEARLGLELPLRTVFQHPTVRSLAAWIDAERRQGTAAGSPIVSGLGGEDAPLSSPQQRLWFFERLHPGVPAYDIPTVHPLQGPLHPQILAAALAEVVRRHDILRTTFVVPAGGAQPIQRVHPATGWDLPVIDLEALPATERNAEAERLAARESLRTFDLERGPLLCTFLLRLRPCEHRLLVNQHHIVSDGVSLEILRRELGLLYGAIAAGWSLPLPELPEPAVRYRDFAAWQQGWLAGAEYARQLALWRDRLEHPPMFELPADHPRPAAWSFRGGVETASLPLDLAAELERRGRRLGASPFMTHLAAFLALVHRHTGQVDLLIGTPVAGRVRAEIEGVLGLFVNTLPLRVRVEGEISFATLIARVRETVLEAQGGQEVPFEKLVAELAPGRDLSRSPLLQIVFALQEAPQAVRLSGELAMEAAEWVHHGTAKFDLSVYATRSDRGLSLWAEHSSTLFDGATIRRLLAHLRNLQQGLVERGEETALGALPLLSPPELTQLIREWNDSWASIPRDSSVHGLFAEQARRRPWAVALLCGDEELSYGELDRRAARIAARLHAAAVGPGDAVGVCAERSLNLVAALLAILKVGAAYVPLDPDYPLERLAVMLADAKVRVVLLQEGLDAALPESGAVLLELDQAAKGEAELAGPGVAVDPSSLAYITFTSGSTGRPKGVAITHRAVVRLVSTVNYCRLDEGETLLQLAPVAFDASTFEIWGALLNGGRVALFPPGPIDLHRLSREVKERGVTTLFLSAGLFHQMVDLRIEGLRPLRQILSGGDFLSPARVRRVLEELPQTAMIHVYGPTEVTTYTTYLRVRPDTEVGATIPIGHPITNTRVVLLDGRLGPVPLGVVGQIYAAGEGLARGYVGRPDLTAERFVPDPVGSEPGGRLYATGDLGRWLPGGRLELLGRSDAQVKVRGFRIELGEIEAALTALAEVESCVVVARADASGDKRLVAYAVARSGRTLEPETLRAQIEARLPAYMIPSAFVALSELPLDRHGKVDRRSLPEPTVSLRDSSTDPRTPLEREVARIWCEALGVPRIGIEDNFWELGGHSLLATLVLSRVEELFGAEVPLRALFASPSLAGFTAAVADRVLADQEEEETDEGLSELEGLSEEEVRALLEQTARELEELS